MRVVSQFKFSETAVLLMLTALVDMNVNQLLDEPRLPNLYGSGVRYKREKVETFSDYASLLEQGHEDCDSLAAAQAALLRTRGWRAMIPGQEGYRTARDEDLLTIDAEVVLVEPKRPPGKRRLYHVIVAYTVGGTTYFDDPSDRLGMRGRLDRSVRALEQA